MKCEVKDINGKKVGDVELNKAIFDIEPRADILDRVIQWQLAKRRAGTHQVKGTSDVQATGKKSVRQKGSGGARHASKKVNLFRGGGVVFGPVTRDHGYGLQKKVRNLGLKMALSAKFQENNMIVVDDLNFNDYSTKTAKKSIDSIVNNESSVLVIDAAKLPLQTQKSFDNLVGIDSLPTCGANVYDIVRKKKLIITMAAVKSLEERLA